MNDVKSIIDFFFNVIYNAWDKVILETGVYGKITIVILFVIPLFAKILRTLRSSDKK